MRNPSGIHPGGGGHCRVVLTAGVGRHLRDEGVVRLGRQAGDVEQDEHVRFRARAEDQVVHG